MTKEELVARLQAIEWDDFEVKNAKGGLPKSVWKTFFDAFVHLSILR